MSENANYSNLDDLDDDEFVNPNDVVGQLRKALKAQQKAAEAGISKLMNGVEPTEESVTAWLSENGKFFGFDPEAKPADKGAEGSDPAPQSHPGLDPEMQAILDA